MTDLPRNVPALLLNLREERFSGAVVVWTRLGLFSTLAHAAIMALLFAAVFLVSAAGVLIFALLTGLSRLALGRWHESEIEAEG